MPDNQAYLGLMTVGGTAIYSWERHDAVFHQPPVDLSIEMISHAFLPSAKERISRLGNADRLGRPFVLRGGPQEVIPLGFSRRPVP
jgi:hypothetical protein